MTFSLAMASLSRGLRDQSVCLMPSAPEVKQKIDPTELVRMMPLIGKKGVKDATNVVYFDNVHQLLDFLYK